MKSLQSLVMSWPLLMYRSAWLGRPIKSLDRPSNQVPGSAVQVKCSHKMCYTFSDRKRYMLVHC